MLIIPQAGLLSVRELTTWVELVLFAARATTAARCKKDRAPRRGNEVLSFDKTPRWC